MNEIYANIASLKELLSALGYSLEWDFSGDWIPYQNGEMIEDNDTIPEHIKQLMNELYEAYEERDSEQI